MAQHRVNSIFFININSFSLMHFAVATDVQLSHDVLRDELNRETSGQKTASLGKKAMDHPIRNAILAVLFFPLVGCSQLAAEKPEPVAAVPHTRVNPHGEATGLVLSVEAMAAELLTNLEDNDPFAGDLAGGMVVTTFVETAKLTRTSSFGRYLSEQLMNEFQRRSFPVVEIRKATEITVQQKRGEFGLARDENELQADISADTMLTGTYFIGPDNIIVTARILNNESAQVIASSTVIFPKNKLTVKMLADTASIRVDNHQPMYLKKLEL